MATFDQFISSLGDEFGEQGKGRPFETFCKWFLENDPEWSRIIDKVWLWDDYPNKWQRQDLGTDLVFRDNEGLIWAVQAKCYGEHRTTTKGDMNSFLADTGRKEVDRRLWLQTTNKIEAKAEKTLKGQDKPTTVFMLNDFRDAQIDYPASFAELYKAKVKDKPKPDPHQIKAIEDVTAGLLSSERGQMIMACGTGKTFTTLWIKEALEAHTTLVLLPSLSLLSQTMREWAWAGNTDFDILNVCSDKSVGKKTEDMDPTDAPFPVTSEVAEIAAFLKKPEPKVVFCTYQSSDLIAQAQLDGAVPAFDLAVADEAHRCAGKADAGFATILDAEKIRAYKRLFTTATPRYFGQAIKDEANARDLAVVGMDNEVVFGPVIHKLTFGQAIEQELLTDYQVVIVGVDEPMVREWIENYEIVSTDSDSQTDARTLAAKIGLLKAIKDYDLKRVISFHSRVAGAKKFSEEFIDIANLIAPPSRPEGTFLTDYVSGDMQAGVRKEKIDRLKILEGYDRGVLTNARCLAEGVDVPSLDGVAFIDPKGSQVEIIQAVGRAIRKVREAKVQKKGTIVLPVFIKDGDDHEASIASSNFKPVWDVLKALRAHDEVLAHNLDLYRTKMVHSALQNRKNISDKIIFDLPKSLPADFVPTLRTVLVETTTETWEFWFGLLQQFKRREGHCQVPQNHKERLSWDFWFELLKSFHEEKGHINVPRNFKSSGFRLGYWLQMQLSNFHILPPEHKKKLEMFDLNHHSFLQKMDDEFGSQILLPKELPLFDEYALGDWLRRQLNEQDYLSIDRLARLNQLGVASDYKGKRWETGFSKLRKFVAREGTCSVPLNHIEEGYKLGTWVAKQRSEFNKISQDRFIKLDSLGFIWEAKNQLWENGYQKLLKFKEREGHCNVPRGFVEGGFNLGNWTSTQRSKKNTLPEERLIRLERIGFAWTLNTNNLSGVQKKTISVSAESTEKISKESIYWEEGYAKLLAFKEREGHCRVPVKHNEDGYNLGDWVTKQRIRKLDMASEIREKLDLEGFVWDPFKASWEEGYAKLLAFKGREGHCRVPVKHNEDGYSLGDWVRRQRARKLDLTGNRKRRLNDIGFVWNINNLRL